MKQLKNLALSFYYALRGIGYAVATQRNLRIDLVALCLVLIFGMMAHISVTHWCVVLICCMVVISLELLNTAMESLCDKLTSKSNPLIRHAKDAAAGAVLIAAIGSLAVAIVILAGTPEYRTYIAAVWNSGLRPKIGLAIDAVAALIFIFVPSGSRKK